MEKIMPSRNKDKNDKKDNNTKKEPAKTKKKAGITTLNPIKGTKFTFFSDLARKWAHMSKDQDEEDDGNIIVRYIIESVTKALPVKYKLSKQESIKKIIESQKIAPELLPNDTVEVPKSLIDVSSPELVTIKEPSPPLSPRGFVIPRMPLPLISSNIFKPPAPKKKKKITLDAAINTEEEESTADALVKHVHTLRKISLIAEEFNKKTARNLKEIVDSVQEDLVKKLEEMRAQEVKCVTVPRVKILDNSSKKTAEKV